MATTTLTTERFESTVSGDGIVLVDWWASWCGPCRQFAPVYEAASERHPDIVFAKIDTEAERQLSGMAGISSIPTLMAFRDGILVFSQPGALPAPALEQVIEAVRGLDMDDVRRQVAARQAQPDELDLDTFAADHAAGGYVLDVRTEQEYAAGHVAGAVHIPVDELPGRVDEVPATGRVNVICAVGNRSRAAADLLRRTGRDAVNVTDGTEGWAARGWPLER